MSIVINLTDQQREDLLVTALEGGSNYWYLLLQDAVKIIRDATQRYKKGTPFSVLFWYAIKAGAVVPIHDNEDEGGNKIGEISLASIEKGEQLLADNHFHYVSDILTDNMDAATADAWFQYCSLGKLTYG
jgi:hypothetical protein